MRLRVRLTLTLVAAHLVLITVVAVLAWRWVDEALRTQAEESALSVGRVLARGGFSTDERVLDRMRELSGHDFRLLNRASDARPGYVVVNQGAIAVEVDYRTERYATARRTLLLATLAVAVLGSLAFAIVAWLLARRFARPIEDLSTAARALGDDLSRLVPQVGVGEIAGLARELEAMRARLVAAAEAARHAERLATLGTFAATVAHEVRNPLTAVALHVQMLRQDAPSDPDLQRIAEELERLDLVVDEVLSFSRGMRCDVAACDLRVVADDVTRLLRRQAEHAGVALSCAGHATVQADPRRLRQLLLNLVLNAIQACSGGRGSAVLIHLEPAAMTVEDDGPGVANDLAPRLFAPFATGRDQGTGLGLHLAKAIADAHGAHLSYARTDERTRFTLRFSS
jgi:signal transduction histidine kinase